MLSLIATQSLKITRHGRNLRWICSKTPPKPLNFYINLLKTSRTISEAQQVHAHFIILQLLNNFYATTTLISTFSKLSLNGLKIAQLVFNQIPTKTIFSYNALIAGNALHGFHNLALELYHHMKWQAIKPDNYTYPWILKGFAELPYIPIIHGELVKNGFDSDVFTCGSLIGAYLDFGEIELARQVFDKMHTRDIVAWNVMISGYAQCGSPLASLGLFRDMSSQGYVPSSGSLVTALSSCSPSEGREVHSFVVRSGMVSEGNLSNAIVTMYSKHHCVESAEKAFCGMLHKDLVSWNAMIAGYAQNGCYIQALKLFSTMWGNSIRPDGVTVTSVLPAFGHARDLRLGRCVHGFIAKTGLDFDVFVTNALIDMYSRCNSVSDALSLFNFADTQKDLVSWNTAMNGFLENGHFGEVLNLFYQMSNAGVRVDSVSVVVLLSSVGHMACFKHGKEVHGFVLRNGFHVDISILNAIIDMYGKCGSLECAERFYSLMPRRDLISWTTIIHCYGLHGHGSKALEIFYRMLKQGLRPDHVTFMAVLIACNHSGMVQEGRELFSMMQKDSRAKISVEHYACFVDLLARSGHLHEAYESIKSMPMQPSATVWGALLGACKIHDNLELAEIAARKLLELAPDNTGYYILLSNMYASASKWEEVAKIRAMVRWKGLKKNAGRSWIETNNKVHSFVADDKLHPQYNDILPLLEKLLQSMKLAGYVPNTNIALPDIGY